MRYRYREQSAAGTRNSAVADKPCDAFLAWPLEHPSPRVTMHAEFGRSIGQTVYVWVGAWLHWPLDPPMSRPYLFCYRPTESIRKRKL